MRRRAVALSIAAALSRARFASGLLPPSYTTRWDTIPAIVETDQKSANSHSRTSTEVHATQARQMWDGDPRARASDGAAKLFAALNVFGGKVGVAVACRFRGAESQRAAEPWTPAAPRLKVADHRT